MIGTQEVARRFKKVGDPDIVGVFPGKPSSLKQLNRSSFEFISQNLRPHLPSEAIALQIEHDPSQS